MMMKVMSEDKGDGNEFEYLRVLMKLTHLQNIFHKIKIIFTFVLI